MRYLLDVNLWIALLDDAHTHLARANTIIEKRGIKIATCPLVETGVIRVLNVPGYGMRGAIGIDQVPQQLKRATTELDHEFGPMMFPYSMTIVSTSAKCLATTR